MFEKVLLDCSLMDLGVVVSNFTWVRQAKGSKRMLKKLDRALSNIAWRRMFPEAFTETLPHLLSDHAPLLLRRGGKVLEKGVCPFCFLAA